MAITCSVNAGSGEGRTIDEVKKWFDLKSEAKKYSSANRSSVEVGRYSLVPSTSTSRFYSLVYRDFLLGTGTSHKLPILFSALSISGSRGRK